MTDPVELSTAVPTMLIARLIEGARHAAVHADRLDGEHFYVCEKIREVEIWIESGAIEPSDQVIRSIARVVDHLLDRKAEIPRHTFELAVSVCKWLEAREKKSLSEFLNGKKLAAALRAYFEESGPRSS
jgi:hypothetical protein